MKNLNKIIVWCLRALIYAYRYTLSSFMGRECRFQPTFSVFALEALEKHGPWRGWAMAIKRILSCHPWGGSGYHPVPDSATCKHPDKPL